MNLEILLSFTKFLNCFKAAGRAWRQFLLYSQEESRAASCPHQESQGWPGPPMEEAKHDCSAQLSVEFKEHVSHGSPHLFLGICYHNSTRPPCTPEHHNWKDSPKMSESPGECTPGLLELMSFQSSSFH